MNLKVISPVPNSSLSTVLDIDSYFLRQHLSQRVSWMASSHYDTLHHRFCCRTQISKVCNKTEAVGDTQRAWADRQRDLSPSLAVRRCDILNLFDIIATWCHCTRDVTTVQNQASQSKFRQSNWRKVKLSRGGIQSSWHTFINITERVELLVERIWSS